jgi:hypothetical protein
MTTTDTTPQPADPRTGGIEDLRAAQDQRDEPARPGRRLRRAGVQIGLTVAVVGAAVGLAGPAQASYDSSRWEDVDGNNTWDYVWDWDADNDPDAVYVDLDGDGNWEFGLADVYEDGVIDAVDMDIDFWFEYTVDQLPSQGLSLVIDMGCGDGHCVSPDMGMVGLALPDGWSTF